MKRAPEKIFPEMLATEWGGGGANDTKYNLNNMFHEGKGHFATGERALFVFSELNLGGLAPPGSYAPVHYIPIIIEKYNINIQISLEISFDKNSTT